MSFLLQNRSSPEVVSAALNFSPPDPASRFEMIRAGWEQLGYGQSQFLAGAGITVEKKPVAIHGRKLEAPEVVFGGKQAVPIQVSARSLSHALILYTQLICTQRGTWDVIRKTLYTAATLNCWFVANITDPSQTDPRAIQVFVGDLMKEMRMRGEFRAALPRISLYNLTVGHCRHE